MRQCVAAVNRQGSRLPYSVLRCLRARLRLPLLCLSTSRHLLLPPACPHVSCRVAQDKVCRAKGNTQVGGGPWTQTWHELDSTAAAVALLLFETCHGVCGLIPSLRAASYTTRTPHVPSRVCRRCCIHHMLPPVLLLLPRLLLPRWWWWRRLCCDAGWRAAAGHLVQGMRCSLTAIGVTATWRLRSLAPPETRVEIKHVEPTAARRPAAASRSRIQAHQRAAPAITSRGGLAIEGHRRAAAATTAGSGGEGGREGGREGGTSQAQVWPKSRRGGGWQVEETMGAAFGRARGERASYC